MSKGYQKVLDKYPKMFKSELKGTKAKIHVDPQAKPRFLSHIPFYIYVLRERTREATERGHY